VLKRVVRQYSIIIIHMLTKFFVWWYIGITLFDRVSVNIFCISNSS